MVGRNTALMLMVLPALAAVLELLAARSTSSGSSSRPGDVLPLAPSTSLDTLPVVYMGGNSAPRPKENIEMLAKMRYVVIEKWEGPCWNECLANVSKQLPCEPSCDEEAVQMATLAAVKKLN
eukprot:SAG31_NODE_27251_length_429_cov_0.787879_1_plen_121_part_10